MAMTPIFTTGISTLSPASTYPDLLLINNAGQGLNNTSSQVQDGLGNRTNMTISSNYINFDRSVSQFQLDGVALTASAATLNNVSDVANGQYILVTPNAQLANASVLSANNGISLTIGAGSALIHVDPASPLAGIQQLVGGGTGILVYQNDSAFATVDLVGDSTIHITNPDGTTGNPTFHVVDSTSLQWVNVALNGAIQSKQSQLNFIPGPGAGINILDNPASNRTDITISSTGSSGPLHFLGGVYAATTADVGATYDNGAAGIGATLTAVADGAFTTDGTTPPVNSIILVKNQIAPSENGIYTLTNAGGVSTPFLLTRVNYFDSSSTITPGDTVIVLNGTSFHATGWIETSTVTNVGTDPINFVQFAVSGSVTSVNGTPNQIDVANPDTTPVISISGSYVGQASITTVGTITSGAWQSSTPVGVPYGGTGLATLTTAYGVLCAGTTATGVLQNAGTGLPGEVLTSFGGAALPQWQPLAASSFNIPVTQAGHGFVTGDVIRVSGSNTYTKAQADSQAHAQSVVGIVVAVSDVNNFVYQFGGIITGQVGLTAGQTYFLSPITAGVYTTTEPTNAGLVQLPLLIALSATTALLQIGVAVLVAAANP